jgi:nicotinate-nucleotide adenylyltransferase
MGKPAAAVCLAEAPPAPACALPPLMRPDARVGLFGGTFDPVHLGHLALAQTAVRDLSLDHLFFIPANQAPLRDGPPAASAADRLELLHRALAETSNPRFGLLDLEAASPGVHYTVDTLRHLHAAWPRARLFWLLGADQLAQLDLWREPRELAQLVEFAVLDRPGQPHATPPVALPGLRLHRLTGPTHPANASAIRRRLQTGESGDLWLPPAVAAAIEERQLYR